MSKLSIKNYVIFLALFLFLAGCKTVTLEGTVAVKGSEPHTYLVVITEKYGEVRIVGKYKQTIMNKYQNRHIKIEGLIVEKERGPGNPAQIEVSKIVN